MKRLIIVVLCLILAQNVTFADGIIGGGVFVESESNLSRITAYAPHDNRSGICGGGKTSLGFEPSRKYAAVDPRKIPYGTIIEVPGYGTVIAADTGGALRSYDGYAIDLYFETYEEAMAWGVKEIKVTFRGYYERKKALSMGAVQW